MTDMSNNFQIKHTTFFSIYFNDKPWNSKWQQTPTKTFGSEDDTGSKLSNKQEKLAETVEYSNV